MFTHPMYVLVNYTLSHLTRGYTVDFIPTAVNKVRREHVTIKQICKITRLQRWANCINMLRHWWERFNFQCVKVDTQVPRNDILIYNDNVTCRMVVMNETRNTARRTTITWQCQCALSICNTVCHLSAYKSEHLHHTVIACC